MIRLRNKRIKSQKKQKNIRERFLPNIFLWNDVMFAQVKLSARRALLGEELSVLPGTFLLMFFFLLFSLCNAGLTVVPYDIPPSVLSAVAFLSAPLALFCISPLKLKMQRRYILLYSGARSSDSVDFECGVNSCILNLILLIIRLFYFAVYEALPFTAVFFLLKKLREENMSEKIVVSVAIGIAATFLIGIFAFFIHIQKYSRAEFYLAAYRGLSPLDAIKLSKKHTEGKLLNTALFKIGFLPWLFLCIFGLPVLYVLPYYKQSLTALFIEY